MNSPTGKHFSFKLDDKAVQLLAHVTAANPKATSMVLETPRMNSSLRKWIAESKAATGDSGVFTRNEMIQWLESLGVTGYELARVKALPESTYFWRKFDGPQDSSENSFFSVAFSYTPTSEDSPNA